MKKSIVLFSALSLLVFLISGCASAPIHVNLTGKWNYDYEPNNVDKVMTGSMDLHQNDYKLTGTANDADGSFVLTGTITNDELTIKGSDASKKRDFTINATLKCDSSFSGTYQTNQGVSGTISGVRQ